MHPVLFKIGPLTVYSYGVLLAFAAVLCAFLMGRDGAAKGIPKEKIYDFMFAAMIGGLLGARLFYVWIAWPEFAGNVWEIIRLDHGGLAWQGGFLGGTLAGMWFVRRHKWSMRGTMDLCAPYVALGQSIGRLGCFFNGCCFGKICEVGGIRFPGHYEMRIPTQLYEAGSLFLIYVLLKAAQKRGYKPGMVFVFYLWLAGLERFIIEFFRADQTIVWQGLSPFQYVAAGVFITGIIIFLRFRK